MKVIHHSRTIPEADSSPSGNRIMLIDEGPTYHIPRDQLEAIIDQARQDNPYGNSAISGLPRMGGYMVAVNRIQELVDEKWGEYVPK